MTLPKRPIVRIAAILVAAGTVAVGMTVLAPASARAATTQLCQMETTPVSGGIYTVQNNEFGSGASECITTNGSADFTVANSSIDNATDGAPGAYTSIFQGCHWGNCTSGGLTATPIQVSALTTGKVTTSWSTTQPGGSSNAYDVAYDIWFNQTPTTTGQPNGTELMVWLNHNGSVQPYGSEVASDVTLGGHTYNIWYGKQSTWDTVTFDMTSGTTSVSNLDIGTLTQDSVSLGYTESSWYLIDVEAGFELWQGGAGLETNSFSVDIGGAAPTVPSCSATYSLVNSSPGTFQGQVVLTDTGTSPFNGWSLAWTFPGNEEINDLWNGTYTQSGESVSVTNASYNGSVDPGDSVTVGFGGTYTSSDASPTSVNCTG
jgi:Glycosyl hydrolase family 12/Cellulose binding domain